ncbi:4833_t:CDS:2, partial [Racocetra fulgida]
SHKKLAENIALEKVQEKSVEIKNFINVLCSTNRFKEKEVLRYSNFTSEEVNNLKAKIAKLEEKVIGETELQCDV